MLNYIILGILQGIFEWLPISSEGIIALTSQILIKETNPIDIAIFLHTGTLLAVLFYFRKDWAKLISLKSPKLLKFLTITTATSLIIGYPIYKIIRNVAVGSSLLIIMGFGLLITAYYHKKTSSFNLYKNSNTLALFSGTLQGLSVIPGLSRSGSTIFGLSLGKLTPSKILKISYMMSAPVIIISTVYLLFKNPVLIQGWPSLLSSFIIGTISLSFLMKISEKINFYIFALIIASLCFIGGAITLLQIWMVAEGLIVLVRLNRNA